LSSSAEPAAQRSAILRAAVGIGLYAGAFGMAYGAVAVGSGLSLGQTMLLSLVLFSGGSQFAFAGVVAGGGSGFAAIAAASLLGARNAFYGVPVSQMLQPRGWWRRLGTAHFVIDETTAMAVGQPTAPAQRFAFWATGLILFPLWQLGSLAGALIGTAIDPADFGLEAAAPAVFLGLLWPRLERWDGRLVALAGAAVALALVPVAPAGVPVIAAAAVALVAGLLPSRTAAT
jgi:4-azaleucine resistance transporter AzlC